MYRILVFICFLLCSIFCHTQTIPIERTTDWSRTGLQLEPPQPTLFLEITDFGAVGDGVQPAGPALALAFAAAQGEMAVIGFPAGNFLFTSGIELPDSVILRGAGPDQTTFTFSLSGTGHCIRASGQELSGIFPLAADALRGDTTIDAGPGTAIAPGEFIRLYRDDEDLVVSPWAIGTTGQYARVIENDNGILQLSSPLRADYSMAGGAYLRKMQPALFIGIECLKIVREDQTAGQWSNIWMIRASHCWVRGVESDMTNFAHIEISESTNCEISGNYLHHAFDYGTGGKAYGVNLANTSGENLIENNIFEHLRHSMIVQIGANGNVLGYNYSTDPFWASFPSNAAGEIVLHGDHPYLNLFEGNIVQNMVIDDSHGSNGPFNTLFRNRADLWGLFMANSPPTDSTNIVGNEITDPSGLYLINGAGHFLYGNIVQGTITPDGTEQLSDQSYYAASMPAFLDPVGAWPQTGPGAQPPGTIPAEMRHSAGDQLTVCSTDIGTAITTSEADGSAVLPNPFSDRITIAGPGTNSDPLGCSLYDLTGKVVYRARVASAESIMIDGLDDLRSGVYLIELKSGYGVVFRSVVVKE